MAKQFKDMSEAELAVFAQKVAASHLPKTAKRRLLAIVQASTRPEGERVGEDLATLPEGRLLTIGQGMARTVRLGKSIVERGTAELASIPDDEWDDMVAEADDGNAG